MTTASVYPSAKICKDCQQELPLESFHKHDHTRDGRTIYCKPCAAARHKRWRENPEKKKTVNTNWMRHWNKSNQFAWALRLSQPCAVCGESSPHCLDFHHVDPSQKEIQIAKCNSLRKLLDEAAKCCLLCRNCHAKYHAGALNDDGIAPMGKAHVDAVFAQFARDIVLGND